MKNKITLQNKKAYHDFEVGSSLICGIVLTGEDIKKIRKGKFHISGNYCFVNNGELFLKTDNNEYKLLATKKQIRHLNEWVSEKGYTLIAVKLFENVSGLFKIDLRLSKGKKNYDKRNSLKEKDINLEIWKQMKNF